MPGFLTPQQGPGDDCCCNGEVENCKCVAELTECLFTWECSTPRDELNIPRDAPHLIRLVRQESTDPEETVFETALSSGSWIPPESHATSTLYRLDVCCADPGVGECEWKSLGSIVLSGDATCEECTLDGMSCCQGVPYDGGDPATMEIVVELGSSVLTCDCYSDGPSMSTTNWAGLYVVTCEQIPFAPCPGGQLVVDGDTRDCGDGFTSKDFLTITWDENIVTVLLQTFLYSGGSYICARGRSYRFEQTTSNLLLTPAYTDCPGLTLKDAAEQGFSYVSTTEWLPFPSCSYTCSYPDTYLPVVGVLRQ